MVSIRQVEANALPAQREALIDLLIDTVEHGSSVGFLLPLSREEAGHYWDGLAPGLAAGNRLLWTAVDAMGVVGTVQLELVLKRNGVNRAEIQKLLVHSRARRGGVGRELMRTRKCVPANSAADFSTSTPKPARTPKRSIARSDTPASAACRSTRAVPWRVARQRDLLQDTLPSEYRMTRSTPVPDLMPGELLSAAGEIELNAGREDGARHRREHRRSADPGRFALPLFRDQRGTALRSCTGARLSIEHRRRHGGAFRTRAGARGRTGGARRATASSTGSTRR